MRQRLNRFLKVRHGATAIEYGLLAAGISIAIAAVVFLLGGNLDTVFTGLNTSISG
jgi:pilus assembly protein Flp/PilA